MILQQQQQQQLFGTAEKLAALPPPRASGLISASSCSTSSAFKSVQFEGSAPPRRLPLISRRLCVDGTRTSVGWGE